ncbi:MAG: hypothetical protein O7J95_09290 [Planctomycetota bacterium]|nr:hypothetical protein [Planctomycetota bacterium]
MRPVSRQLAEQDRDHRIWLVVRLFYTSLVEFRREFASYETKVRRVAESTGVRREALRLRPAELAALLDFKSLEALRDGYIHELKDLCHLLFRTKDQTDPLDRYVSDIFHEISILKEEHYTVMTYAPMHEQAADKVELAYILDEAHKMFPQKLGQVQYLFGRALERMEQHLSSFGKTQIVIRSLYHHQARFVRQAYPDGLRDFYRRMYPCGPLEGFYQVGLSFYHSGFFAEALEAFRLALGEHEEAMAALNPRRAAARGRRVEPQESGDNGAGNPGRPTRERVSFILRSLRSKVRRLEGRPGDVFPGDVLPGAIAVRAGSAPGGAVE